MCVSRTKKEEVAVGVVVVHLTVTDNPLRIQPWSMNKKSRCPLIQSIVILVTNNPKPGGTYTLYSGEYTARLFGGDNL